MIDDKPLSLDVDEHRRQRRECARCSADAGGVNAQGSQLVDDQITGRVVTETTHQRDLSAEGRGRHGRVGCHAATDLMSGRGSILARSVRMGGHLEDDVLHSNSDAHQPHG